MSLAVTPPQSRPATQKGPTGLGLKLVSGAVAGVVGVTLIFPLDTIKTRLQDQRTLSNSGWHVVRQIAAREGVRGFYRGLVPNVVGIAPEKGIKLAVNETMRELLAHRANVAPADLPLGLGMLAGATAGFSQVVATNPMEMVKIQMQLAAVDPAAGSGARPPSAWQLVRSLGLRGLYRNTGATLLRDVTFSIVFFPGLALVRQLLQRANVTGSAAAFSAGIIAGSTAAALVTPFDVVKTRLQVLPRPGEPRRYGGIADCFRRIWVEEGPAALVRGYQFRALTIAPMFATSIVVFDILHRLLV